MWDSVARADSPVTGGNEGRILNGEIVNGLECEN